ncbi:MAG TPA: acetate--CoA ligase family protein, partial [Xanthobacteraceae bacterium]|nr:acetate--CoA ligase family protein [Xanthobacteraceae bacterium]
GPAGVSNSESVMMCADWTEEPSRPAIAHLLAPRSVAIVGASSDPGRIGGRPVHYYRQAGFKGRIYPINPNRDEVQGYQAYPTIDSVPDPIDLAVIAIPAAQVAAAIEQCARKSAKAAVVFSAGFAEIGPQGAALQRELLAVASRCGVRLLGPNCLGLFNARIGHFATFSSFPESGPPLPGRVGLVTQSGAYGTHVLMQARARRIGVNIWVSTGNEVDLDVAALIEALADDADTEVIACYLEGVRHGPALMRALGAAHAARKPVILMKVGRSAVGAEAAASHTASLAGSDAVFAAALRSYGVARVETTERFLDLTYAASRARLPRGNRLGIVTISGGAGVLMADAAEAEGLEVPPLPIAAQRRLLAANPLGSPRNPVDITGQALNNIDLVRQHVAAICEDATYDCAVGFFTAWPTVSRLGPQLQSALREGTQGRAERPMALVILAPPDIAQAYEADGFLVFEDPSRAIAALGGMVRLSVRLNAQPRRPPPARAPAARLLPLRPLSEVEAKGLLSQAGINLLPERLVGSAEAARAAAAALGCPVAMKIVSSQIAHKSEIGAVVLDVASPDAAAAAFGQLMAALARAAPDARTEGILVSPMVKDGVELILAAKNDVVFGPVTMVGIGGIFVEVLKDVVLRIGAVDADEALRMLKELKGYALLAGARGRPAADLDAAAEAMAAFSAYALANAGRFDSIEINPLVVRPRGHGAVALDAWIVPATPAGGGSNP